MKILHLVCLLSLLALAVSPALAKRAAPPAVEPVAAEGIQYRVSADHPGCVEAIDVKTKQPLWFRQVYTIRYDANLERDVQDVHVSSLKLEGGTLLITSERGGEYQLDLKTLDVKVLKGSAVWKR